MYLEMKPYLRRNFFRSSNASVKHVKIPKMNIAISEQLQSERQETLREDDSFCLKSELYTPLVWREN